MSHTGSCGWTLSSIGGAVGKVVGSYQRKYDMGGGHEMSQSILSPCSLCSLTLDAVWPVGFLLLSLFQFHCDQLYIFKLEARILFLPSLNCFSSGLLQQWEGWVIQREKEVHAHGHKLWSDKEPHYCAVSLYTVDTVIFKRRGNWYIWESRSRWLHNVNYYILNSRLQIVVI